MNARTLPNGRVAFETARLKLSRYRVEGEEARARAAAHATQVSADALRVRRVGVWMFRGTDATLKLQCLCSFDALSRTHSAGQVLEAKDFPTYVRGLLERRVVVAEDALTHPLTRELAEPYLVPNGITSMLDAPIIRDGQVLGVVCHEHVGPERRHFEPHELGFASSVADMITLIFEQSERLELEAALQEQTEQRQESQKMEALGRLACGVAHDINNVLSVVSLTLGVLERLGGDRPELRSLTERATQMVTTGQRLSQQLLAFGRNDEDDSGSCDLVSVISGMRALLESAAGGRHTLVLDLRLREARAGIAVSLAEQIVLNLVINARDALGEAEGRIVVAVREPTPIDDVPPFTVVLEVRDDGVGMDEATRARVFEPYFTTKRTGTGLGLATVHGIVRRSGGVVRVISELGSGTTMLLALPLQSTS